MRNRENTRGLNRLWLLLPLYAEAGKTGEEYVRLDQIGLWETPNPVFPSINRGKDGCFGGEYKKIPQGVVSCGLRDGVSYTLER